MLVTRLRVLELIFALKSKRWADFYAGSFAQEARTGMPANAPGGNLPCTVLAGQPTGATHRSPRARKSLLLKPQRRRGMRLHKGWQSAAAMRCGSLKDLQCITSNT